jgi:type IX secretion system PorP/SprF family membrane protein
MKKITMICIVNCFAFCIKAQQLPLYTNYVLNNYAYNPAVAGSKAGATVNLNYRNQWTGFSDAPRTYFLSVHGGLGAQKKVGIGAIINSDNTGLLSKTTGHLTFACHVKLNKTYKLSLGISGGMVQYRIKLYDAKIADAGDELLAGNLLSNNVFDSNAGLYFYSDKLFVGISGYQFLGNKITWKDSKSNLTPHIYGTIGYKIKASKNLNIEPSALIKYNKPVSLQPEFSLRGIYKNAFWLGASYRLNDAATAMLGFIIKEKFTIAYAYDLSLSNLKKYNTGSHEISLAYQFIKKKRKLDADEKELMDTDNSIKSKLKKQNEESSK